MNIYRTIINLLVFVGLLMASYRLSVEYDIAIATHDPIIAAHAIARMLMALFVVIGIGVYHILVTVAEKKS